MTAMVLKWSPRMFMPRTVLKFGSNWLVPQAVDIASSKKNLRNVRLMVCLFDAMLSLDRDGMTQIAGTVRRAKRGQRVPLR